VNQVNTLFLRKVASILQRLGYVDPCQMLKEQWRGPRNSIAVSHGARTRLPAPVPTAGGAGKEISENNWNNGLLEWCNVGVWMRLFVEKFFDEKLS
jgi:hypothetical protein